MRAISIFLALAMVMAGTLAFLPQNVGAVDPPKLLITVEAGVGADFRFNPATIILPQVPIVLNVTLFNNGTVDTLHTFSIRDSAGTRRVNIETLHHGDRASLEFTVSSATSIVVGGTSYQAEASPAGGIKFFCTPHESLNPPMMGNIVVGGATQKQSPEIGIFLRAYWIGLIGLAAMLLWTVITYFIIKGSSRHLKDHRDHIRRGLT